MTISRRRLLGQALVGSAALLAACRTPVPNTPGPSSTEAPASPIPPTSTTQATSATLASSPTPPAIGTTAPSATTAATETTTPRPRLLLPSISKERVPTVAPPTPVPSATPVAATNTPRPAGPLPTPRATDTPRPTPPPGATAGPRIPVHKMTKWGLGVYMEGNEIFDSLYMAKPSVLLPIDPSAGWAQRIRPWFPKACPL